MKEKYMIVRTAKELVHCQTTNSSIFQSCYEIVEMGYDTLEDAYKAR